MASGLSNATRQAGLHRHRPGHLHRLRALVSDGTCVQVLRSLPGPVSRSDDLVAACSKSR
jgi:hypothetical protein